MRWNGNYIFCIIVLFNVMRAESDLDMFRIKKTDTTFIVDPHERFGHRMMEGTSEVMKETVELHRNLFSVESVRILTACAPLYVTARSVDHKLHAKFYDEKLHKNVNQPNAAACEAVEKGAIIGVVGLSSLAFFSSDEELRITSRIFAIGAASGLCAKNVIKKMRFKAGLRPWHEDFSSKERSYGGFPSGHMFEAAYMTTVYGLQYGLKAGIPLGIFSSAMLGMSIACNRHYASQTVAGVALGVMYGLAAHQLIERKIVEETSIDFCSDDRGLPAVRLAYYF